jgi:hypothetical protein
VSFTVDPEKAAALLRKIMDVHEYYSGGVVDYEMPAAAQMADGSLMLFSAECPTPFAAVIAIEDYLAMRNALVEAGLMSESKMPSLKPRTPSPEIEAALREIQYGKPRRKRGRPPTVDGDDAEALKSLFRARPYDSAARIAERFCETTGRRIPRNTVLDYRKRWREELQAEFESEGRQAVMGEA